jgi:polyhydroxybutyrate depolymerase
MTSSHSLGSNSASSGFGRRTTSRVVLIFGVLLLASAGCQDPQVAPGADSGTSVIDAGRDSSDTDSAPPPPRDAAVDAPVEPPFVWVPPVLSARSSGCGKAANGTGAGGVQVQLPSGRSFRLVVPAGYDANKAYPTVFAYHGWYTDGSGFKGWFKFESWVGSGGIVIYPDANNGNGTFDLSGDRDLTAFDDILKYVQTGYCTNPQRNFALGFSYGGKFGSHLACHRAGYVRAIALGATSAGDRGADTRCGRLPMLITHRPSDGDEAYAWGKENADHWAGKLGCAKNQETLFDPALKCLGTSACTAPGSVHFCTDDENYSNIPGYDASWNHTIGERYRAQIWQWFQTFQ